MGEVYGVERSFARSPVRPFAYFLPPARRIMGAPILIVDDDPDSLDIVRTYLESLGYTVATAMDGKEALAKLEEVQPAVLLLDVMMPGMDGWEVARVVKNHPHFQSVRVIMMTARSDFTDKTEGLRAGADDYIVKPIQLEELGRRVERNLKARERTA
jgi:DNA-binding response OmpR family regulator